MCARYRSTGEVQGYLVRRSQMLAIFVLVKLAEPDGHPGLGGIIEKYSGAKYQVPVPRPLPDPMPLPMPLVVRRAPVPELFDAPLVPRPPIGTWPGVAECVVLVALPEGLPLPRCDGFTPRAAASAFFLSSSSARFAAATRRSCSSSSLRSAACRLA
jgi:hypothetical protein